VPNCISVAARRLASRPTTSSAAMLQSGNSRSEISEKASSES
jgi:hypothetical protein